MAIKSFRYLALIAVVILASGCTTLGKIPSDEEKKPKSFAAYAEEVFRRQNTATSQIMTLSPEDMDDPEQYEELLAAEKDMQSACELLNDYAQRSQDGESTSLFFRSRVGHAVKNCDQATQKLETLLEELDLSVLDQKHHSE